MDECTVISYPGTRSEQLLCLTESRSRYMLPICGTFRVVDFTLRNSFTSGARTTILYNNRDDDLEEYVERYGPFQGTKFPTIKVITREYSDIEVCYKLILESNTAYYIIYNGDNPSIIDFAGIIKRYKAKRTGAVLFKLNMNGRPTMAHTVLVSDQKMLLHVIRTAIKQKKSAPNIFEMINNIMINRGIPKSNTEACYWSIKNVPEYYDLNRSIVRDQDIFGLMYREELFKSRVLPEGQAYVGRRAKITHSFISDRCRINGMVENSIIYPGVEIGENTVVKDSIILPYNKIGSGARIVKTILDERTDQDPGLDYLNIGDSCRIGSGEEHIKNTDFPQTLFFSITLIGKNCRIAEGTRIGGGCYVSSGMGSRIAVEKKYIYDGTSLLGERMVMKS
jgi:ADP-glucose pyrophosphorylase